MFIIKSANFYYGLSRYAVNEFHLGKMPKFEVLTDEVKGQIEAILSRASGGHKLSITDSAINPNGSLYIVGDGFDVLFQNVT